MESNSSNPDKEDSQEKSLEENSDLDFKKARNRDLTLFLLTVLILIVFGIAGGLVYDKYFKFEPRDIEFPAVEIPNADD